MRMRRLGGQVAVVLAVGMSVVAASAPGAVSRNRLVTARAAGVVRLGSTLAQARQALPGLKLRRGSDGDGVALVDVQRGEHTVMRLYAGEPDPGRPVNWRAKIQHVEVWDRGYRTAAGVYPGMPLREVVKRYGSLRRIMMSEIESREYAYFSRAPRGLTFRVQSPSGTAGRYREGSNTTAAYAPSTRIAAILIRE